MTYRRGTVRCPDPEVLAQLGAGTLTGAEREALLDHAASCADCHAVVAVLAEATIRSTPAGGPERAPAARVDRYELRRIVGRGAMGVVYAAFDPELDREVAVKILRPNASAVRLRREAQALAKLTHPNVVRVYDVGEHDGQTFIAMELVEGENLREWLQRPHALDAIVDVLVQAGRGLAAAHHAGLVHRDFKPDNVLLARTGGVLVGDFGLARSAALASSENAAVAVEARALSSASLTETGAVVGTPAYMAPEQAAGEATPASDQYAFCVTAWEACFGQRPIAGETVRELRDNAMATSLHKPADRAVPKRLEQALRRGLASRPEDRFDGMDALLRALAPPTRRRWPWLAAATLAVAGATTLVVLTASTRRSGVRCDDAGALIAPAWSPAVEARVTERWNASVAHGFARYAASWQQQRVDACRATHERREQTVATLERRVACLDRARAALHTTIDALLHVPTTALPRPAHAVESLPSLARCTSAAPLPVAPPPDRAAAIAALDRELAALDVSLLAGAPSISATATVALRRQAEALGDAPQVLRAMLLEAGVASWSGDAAAAEAVLRRTLVLADQAADDFTRARAGAVLARLLADSRLVEATGLASAARAALTRAGDDPTIEQAVLEAEVAIATSRGDHREAVAVQERLVAAVRARLGDDSPILMHAYSRLGVLWTSAGDLAQAMVAQRRALEIVVRSEPDGSPQDVTAILGASVTALVTAGDFEGAAALARRQLAVMRGLPAHSLKNEAYTSGQLGFALEIDGNWRDALAAYREAERLWSRPAAEFTTVDEEPDPVAMTAGVVDAVFAQGTCLLNIGRVADAITTLQRARALAQAGGDATRATLDPIARSLGRALVAAGRHRDARDLLEPLADQLATDPTIKPFPRAAALFALAQALWADGGQRDRPRALALAADAERHLTLAIADGEAMPYLRKLPALARAELARIAAWRAAHPAR